MSRSASIARTTAETDIRIRLELEINHVPQAVLVKNRRPVRHLALRRFYHNPIFIRCLHLFINHLHVFLIDRGAF